MSYNAITREKKENVKMPGLTQKQEAKLKEIVSNNLKNLIDAMKWSQATFARETGITEPTLSNYLKGDDEKGRLPSLDYMFGLCMNEEFKAKGLNLTVDLLMSEKFNPKALIDKKYNHPVVSRNAVKHGDFLGNYLCYFFDQSKPVYNQDYNEKRELRYGVISVFDVYESLTGEVEIKVLAAFFKERDVETAIELKDALDSIFNYEAENVSIDSRNAAIEKAFKIDNVPAYEGVVTFSDYHTFIYMQSDVYGDNALISLYSPQKKANSEYVGGLGCVSSITRGRSHMPSLQKIMMSKYELKCTPEMIAEKLHMSVDGEASEIDLGSETEALCEFSRKLYMAQDYSLLFDDKDKEALVRRRLEQIVKNYIKKNFCCVGTVTEAEDTEVFKFIERYKIN